MNFFQTPEYLQIFRDNFCDQKNIIDEVWEKVGDKLILLGMKPILGNQEVTDYAKMDIDKLPEGYKKIQLDYVREDSETYKRFGPGKPQEVSPYLDLPHTWGEYLDNLDRHYRKELKRKLKRLQETEYKIAEEDNLNEFIRLHRLSDPAKSKFMTEPMAKFFKQVYEAKVPGWKTALSFLKIEGKNTAAIMTFESETELWLYNSGYDPEFSYYSVGLLLKALSIKQAIETGKKKYDFLRGNERYKYELGAKDLQLYKIEIKF